MQYKAGKQCLLFFLLLKLVRFSCCFFVDLVMLVSDLSQILEKFRIKISDERTKPETILRTHKVEKFLMFIISSLLLKILKCCYRRCIFCEKAWYKTVDGLS